MQVYADLCILTARPREEETGEVPHHLYGCVDAAVNFSVGHYLKAAAAALEQCREEKCLPVFVGGTGLYFKVLLEGLSAIPDVPQEVREAIRSAAEGEETPVLHQRLTAQDPAIAARLRPTDRLRILRALEVFAATGRSLLDFHHTREAPLLDARTCRKIVLDIPRETLNRRIDARFVAMIEAGALEEVKHLCARRLDPLLPVMRAHGVPALRRHLAGEISLEEAIRIGQGDTRAYAKRQRTWARHQMPDWERMEISCS
jgi:tRNA dimethylallyltransferase